MVETYLHKLHKQTCPNIRGKIINSKTLEQHWLSCKTYNCPVCGPKRVARLRKAVRKWLDKQKFVRIWTFTLTSKVGTPEEHYIVLTKAFTNVIKDIRRLAKFKSVNKIHYIAIREPHESGYTHLHVLVTHWIDVHTLQALYEAHVTKFLASRGDLQGKICNVHIEAVFTKRGIANYVTKYITKSIQSNTIYKQHYTKSQFRLFEQKKKVTDGVWLFIPGRPTILVIDIECYSNLNDENMRNLIAEIVNFYPGDAWEPPG